MNSDPYVNISPAGPRANSSGFGSSVQGGKVCPLSFDPRHRMICSDLGSCRLETGGSSFLLGADEPSGKAIVIRRCAKTGSKLSAFFARLASSSNTLQAVLITDLSCALSTSFNDFIDSSVHSRANARYSCLSSLPGYFCWTSLTRALARIASGVVFYIVTWIFSFSDEAAFCCSACEAIYCWLSN